MNKIIASASAVALGLVGVQSAFAAEPQVESEKALPWLSASLSVRGFYDDNINSSYDGPSGVQDSAGFQIVPSVGLKYEDDLMLASIRYEYGYTWYADRTPEDDQSHLVDLVFSRQFSDNVRLEINDSFAVAQEPSVLSDFAGQQLVTRAEGDNMRNFAEIVLGVQYYENLGFEVGYRNAYWDFEDDGYGFYLNRVEHTPHIDLYYDLNEMNRFFIGYQMNYADYLGNGSQPLYGKYGPLYSDNASYTQGIPATYGSDIYDRMSHAGYVGYRLTLAQGIDWTTRLGAQYTEWQNVDDYDIDYYSPFGGGAATRLDFDKDSVNPFVESIFTWQYSDSGSALLGVRHEVGASQWGAMDAEVTSVFANVHHFFTPKFEGALNFVYQHSAYGSSPNASYGDDTHDDYFSVGPSLSYRLTPLDSVQGAFVDLSYSYDYLDSNIPYREYDRNRVTLGLRATY